jgi:hypothetical protein
LRRLASLICVLLVAVLLPVSAAGAAKAKDIAFTGKTSQGEPFDMALKPNGKQVTLHLSFSVSCGSGLGFPDTETITAPAHVTKKGRRLTRVKFDAVGKSDLTLRDPNGTEAKGALEIVVAGNIVLASGNAKGRIEPTITLSNGDKCTSGGTPITWAASVAQTPAESSG